MSDLAPALPASRIRARTHAGLVVALWAAQVALGLAVGWPLVATVRTTYGAHPLGDRVLFEPGGFELVSFGAHELGRMLPALTAHAVVTVLVAFAVRSLLLSTTIAALARRFVGTRRERAFAALAAGARHALGVAGQYVGALLAQGVVVAAGSFVVGVVSEGFGASSGAPTADRLALVAAAPFALAFVFVSVTRDVAATRLVTRNESSWGAMKHSFALVARRPVLLAEYVWRAIVGAALVALGALVATRMGGRPGAALVFLAIVHQLVLALRIALRVSWLAAALRRSA